MLNPSTVAYKKDLGSMPTKNLFHPKIIRFFPDISMGNGHRGLAKIAKKNGLDLENLGWGEYALFVNRAQTILKLFSRGNLIAHLKMPGSARIDMNTISLLPRFFNGSRLDYEGAQKEALERTIRR